MDGDRISALFANLFRDVHRCIRVEIDGDDGCALAGKQDGGFPANSRTGAGDEGHLAFEARPANIIKGGGVSHIRSKYLIRSQSVTDSLNLRCSVRKKWR